MAIQRRLVEAVEITDSRVHVIRLKDIFDASTVNEFEKVVSYLLARNFYKVVVDLGHVEFISSAGWGAFTAELRRVRENQGDLKLVNMSPDVYDVFLLLELDSFIQSFDAVDEALAAFSQPVAAPEPEPARSSILQEIKAASYSREMAEAGSRMAAEKPAPDFSKHWRERTFVEQETYAAAYATPASEKAVFASATRDNERTYKRIEYTLDNYAPLKETEEAVGAPRDKNGADERFEYPVEHFAPGGERKAIAPSDGESFDGQSEYAIGGGAADAEYEGENYSAEPENESDATEQADYAGEREGENHSTASENEPGTFEQAEYVSNEYADQDEHESYSAEPENESDLTEQAEYAGDEHTDDDEYENSSAEFYSEDGVAEQAEYAGEVYADETEYEDSTAEFYGEDGATVQAEYAGDGYADETEYEDSAAGIYGEDGVAEQAENAGDGYADETEYEDSVSEFYGEDGAAEQAEHAGEVYADEAEYEDSFVESEDEYGAAGQAEGDVEAQYDYATAGDDGENGSEHLTPPAPVANGPEMWELILAGGQDSVDPYMFKKSAPMFPEEETPQEIFASGAAKPFSGRPGAKDSLSGSEREVSAPNTSSDADNTFDEFAAVSVEPDLGFAGHEPFVDDNSRTGADSASASAQTGFAHAPAKSSLDGDDDDQFDEFETQDIRDPWILEEIDTLPEEYEMEEGAADEGASSFSATELLSYDLELDASFSPLPDQAYEHSVIETAGESPTHLGALSQAGTEDAFDRLNDLPTPGAEEEAQFAPGFTWQAGERARLPNDDLQEDFLASTAFIENGELSASVSESPSPSSHHGKDEVSHDYPPDGALPKIPASDNLEEIIRAVVATHPEFGAAMICKFIEDRFEPPVLISRSTVYRFLRETGLNTRDKRQEYAEQLFDPSVHTEEI